MAFNILDIMNAATKAEAGQNRDYQDIVVNYRDIVVTKHNKYSMDELQEIATGIEMDGLQQPLVLGRVNGEYWLVSGHRRLGGIKILVAEGKAGFENVKCRYKDMTEIEFRIKSHGRGKEAPKDQGRGNQGSQCVRYRHNRGRKGKRQEVARRKDD